MTNENNENVIDQEEYNHLVDEVEEHVMLHHIDEEIDDEDLIMEGLDQD